MKTYEEILSKISDLERAPSLAREDLMHIQSLIDDFRRINSNEHRKIATLQNSLSDLEEKYLISETEPSPPARKVYKERDSEALSRKLDKFQFRIEANRAIPDKKMLELKSQVSRLGDSDIKARFDVIMAANNSLKLIARRPDSPTPSTGSYLGAGAGAGAGAGDLGLFAPPKESESIFKNHFNGISAAIRQYYDEIAKSRGFSPTASDIQITNAVETISRLETQVLKVINPNILRSKDDAPPPAAIGPCSARLPSLNSPRCTESAESSFADYPLKRQVRGDGNCYYRAIIYAYLEHSLCLDPSYRSELIEQLCTKLDSLRGKFGDDFDNDLRKLISKLKEIEANSDYDVTELAQDMQDSGSELDHLLVRAARALTANAILMHHEDINGYVEDLNSYVIDTLSMKVDADGPAVQLNLLGHSLGVDVTVKNINAAGIISTPDLTKLDSSPYFNIHLLRDDTGQGRGDAHYFLLYDESMAAQLQKVETPVFRMR